MFLRWYGMIRSYTVRGAADQIAELLGQARVPRHSRHEAFDGFGGAHQQRPAPMSQGRLAFAARWARRLETLERLPVAIAPGQYVSAGFADDARSCRDVPDARLDEHAYTQRP